MADTTTMHTGSQPSASRAAVSQTADSKAADSEAADAPASAALRARDRLVITLLLISTFVVILNETIMGVAIPRLIDDLGISAGQAQWLTSGFMLTMAVVIPITGFLLQRFTTRPMFITAMTLFSLGTLIAAIAPGFTVLLLGRIVQASGTAIMFPLLLTTVMTLVDPASRGRMMGNISIVISVAPAIGPTISGLILSVLDWRWMFILILPIALPGIVTGIALLTTIKRAGLEPGLLTIVLGHATFCIVTVYNNVVARFRRMSASQLEASADLGADGWQTFRFVVLPNIATALLAGAMLSFALSFDEVIVTTFTAGKEQTLPIWFLSELFRPRDRPITNVVAIFVIAVTTIPILLAQRLTAEGDDLHGGGK